MKRNKSQKKRIMRSFGIHNTILKMLKEKKKKNNENGISMVNL